MVEAGVVGGHWLGQKSTGGLGQSWPMSLGSRNLCLEHRRGGLVGGCTEGSRHFCPREAGGEQQCPHCSWVVTSLGQGCLCARAEHHRALVHVCVHTHN